VKKARNLLWILFFVSLAMIGAMLLIRGEPQTGAPGPSMPSGETPLLVWIPLLTALVSLTGALTTSILTMRRDRLESRKTALEVTKLQLEIEQLKKNSESWRSNPDEPA
jgi:hypothetical protein